MKFKAAATLSIRNASYMSDKGREAVAKWIEKQAKKLRSGAKRLSSRYKAEYLYPSK